MRLSEEGGPVTEESFVKGEGGFIDLALVILNYCTPDLVTDCLATVLPEIKGLPAKVVIVDNASPDDSVERISAWLFNNDVNQQCVLLVSEVNGGFSAGNNLGIRALKARYYLLLNSDTLIRPGSLKTLLETARADSQAGLISPRLEWPDGEPQISCFRFISPLHELLRISSLGLLARIFPKHVVSIPVTDQASSPQWTSFACVLIRREVFESVGLLDKGYFMYFDDTDFCQRAVNNGWRILHEPKSRVVHLRGGSSSVKRQSQRRKRVPAYFYLSRSRYFRAHYCGRAGLLAANLLWYAGWVLGRLKQLAGKEPPPVCEKEWLDIWKGFMTRQIPFSETLEVRQDVRQSA
ncbi:MAG TPA: glycosyltransferase family 2 protein [Gammaproteobacteria bacterium]|nr:glycosyltransferase family 2 protein [Gammaproteobacteria bacterium]